MSEDNEEYYKERAHEAYEFAKEWKSQYIAMVSEYVELKIYCDKLKQKLKDKECQTNS